MRSSLVLSTALLVVGLVAATTCSASFLFDPDLRPRPMPAPVSRPCRCCPEPKRSRPDPPESPTNDPDAVPEPAPVEGPKPCKYGCCPSRRYWPGMPARSRPVYRHDPTGKPDPSRRPRPINVMADADKNPSGEDKCTSWYPCSSSRRRSRQSEACYRCEMPQTGHQRMITVSYPNCIIQEQCRCSQKRGVLRKCNNGPCNRGRSCNYSLDQ